MPKKTKKQKINAEKRRKNFLFSRVKNELIQENQVKIAIPKSIDRNDMTIKTNVNPDVINYFKHDFKKSLIIVAIIIALEIVIYFGTII